MSAEPTVPVKCARILALSKALGSPITVETREEGDSAEDCLVEMATRRLAFIPKREVVATSVTYNGEHCGNVFTDRDHAYVRMRTLNKNYPDNHRELVDLVPAGTFDMLEHLERQRAFSLHTFGPGKRTEGVVDHIRKELTEVLAKPEDLSEWIDVAILALDGAWRTGATPAQIIEALVAKQTRNEGREWPDWRTMPADQAIEHVRTVDTPEPNGPKYPAVFLVNTINGPTYACTRHARALGAIFGVLGASTMPMPLDDGDQHECANCINEAKAGGAP